MTQILINILLVFHVLVSFLLLIIVLMQRPKSEGLGAAFGGGMTENMFGAQTTNVLTKFTVYLGGLFFLLTLVLAMLIARQTRGVSLLESELLGGEPRVPAAETAPAVIDEPVESATLETTEPTATDELSTEIEPVSVDLSAPAAVDPSLSLEAPAEGATEEEPPATE